jgi:hypothetical protein
MTGLEETDMMFEHQQCLQDRTGTPGTGGIRGVSAEVTA